MRHLRRTTLQVGAKAVWGAKVSCFWVFHNEKDLPTAHPITRPCINNPKANGLCAGSSALDNSSSLLPGMATITNSARKRRSASSADANQHSRPGLKKKRPKQNKRRTVAPFSPVRRLNLSGSDDEDDEEEEEEDDEEDSEDSDDDDEDSSD